MTKRLETQREKEASALSCHAYSLNISFEEWGSWPLSQASHKLIKKKKKNNQKKTTAVI